MTRVVVGEFLKGENNPKIIGMGEYPTRGLRHGYVVHFDDAVNSVKNAVAMAEKTSGVKIRRAYVSIGSTSLRGEISSGIAIVSKADGEVTGLDLNKSLEEAEENLNSQNKRIIHTFPLAHKLDGRDVEGRLEGMRGTKLETKALFVTCSNQHCEDLAEVVTLAGVDPIELIASPIAASHIALSAKQKVAGGAIVNIGAETVSMAVYENEHPISVHTFSIGGDDVTNDIALGLKIPLEKAENLKLGNGLEEFPKKKLDEIIDARLSDIFELIDNHLKKIKRSELLPAGIVFVGGGANTVGLEELAKDTLRLPSVVGSTDMFGLNKTKLKDPAYFTALGLVVSNQDVGGYASGGSGSFEKILKDLKSTLKSGLKQLMP
jgi:cell division protein FtsA